MSSLINGLLLFGGLLGGILLSPSSHANPLLAAERRLFLKAEAAAKTGRWHEFNQLKDRLTHYPLYPYLEFLDYQKNISILSIQQFHYFLDTYKDTPLAAELRASWLKHQAQSKNWREFLHAYEPTEDIGLKCQFLWAELQTRVHPKGILEEVSSLWLYPKPFPPACHPLIDVWEQRGFLTRSLLWQRIKLSLQANEYALALQLAEGLKPYEKKWVPLWIQVRKKPELVRNPHWIAQTHPAAQEMVVDAMTLMAKKHPESALKLWPQLNKQYHFEPRHWNLIVRAIGLALAKQHHPATLKWLGRVSDTYASDEVHEWRVRASLLRGHWKAAYEWLQRFPKLLKEKDEWLYWKARIENTLGLGALAESTLRLLSQHRNFYGFMSAQLLTQPYEMHAAKTILTPQLLQYTANHPGIQRARELKVLGRNTRAVQEWRSVTRFMNDKQRQAAAKLAITWNLPNWAILAFSETKEKSHLNLRFPVVHGQSIFKAADRFALNPALILAVTRMESAFVSEARSPKGALGLMQITPSTGKHLAKRCRLRLTHPHELFKPGLNIHLGSYYLKQLLNQYQQNPALAAAAYNAGPGRVQQWRPEATVPSDVWIENIPFPETRDYVRNVLTYTVIYQQILGQKARGFLSLPPVPADPN